MDALLTMYHTAKLSAPLFAERGPKYMEIPVSLNGPRSAKGAKGAEEH